MIEAGLLPERGPNLQVVLPSTRQIDEFSGRWKPRSYLKDYYQTVMPDEVSTMAFLAENLPQVGRVDEALFFGVGPTLHHVFPVAPFADQLVLADYLPENLQEVHKWLQKTRGAWNWKPFVSYALQCEGVQKPSIDQVRERETLVRTRTRELVSCDASVQNPLGNTKKYPLVLNMYCCDSATADPTTYRRWMRNVASLVADGGHYFTAALQQSDHYMVGRQRFPSANVTPVDVANTLLLDFDDSSIIMRVEALPEHKSLGYEGIILAYARKPQLTTSSLVA